MEGARWQRTLKAGKGKNRVIKVFGESIMGHSVLLCRYLVDLQPPDEIFQSRTDMYAIEKAARYVSLIPFIEDDVAFKDMPDLWCTS